MKSVYLVLVSSVLALSLSCARCSSSSTTTTSASPSTKSSTSAPNSASPTVKTDAATGQALCPCPVGETPAVGQNRPVLPEVVGINEARKAKVSAKQVLSNEKNESKVVQTARLAAKTAKKNAHDLEYIIIECEEEIKTAPPAKKQKLQKLAANARKAKAAAEKRLRAAEKLERIVEKERKVAGSAPAAVQAVQSALDEYYLVDESYRETWTIVEEEAADPEIVEEIGWDTVGDIRDIDHDYEDIEIEVFEAEATGGAATHDNDDADDDDANDADHAEPAVGGAVGGVPQPDEHDDDGQDEGGQDDGGADHDDPAGHDDGGVDDDGGADDPAGDDDSGMDDGAADDGGADDDEE